MKKYTVAVVAVLLAVVVLTSITALPVKADDNNDLLTIILASRPEWGTG